jgi:hypothetical protein
VYDTLDLKVYTQASDGASTIQKKTYYGDGTTVQFDAPTIGVKDGLRVFVNNQYKQIDVDYTLTLDYDNNFVTFNTAPASNSVVNIIGIQVSVDNLIAKFTKQGDGSTTEFDLPITHDRIKQNYTIVNGEKTIVTLSNNDSVSTTATFSTAPAADSLIEFYLFNLDPATKAFSEVVTTTYTDITTDSTENYVTLTTAPAIIGPYHNKAIVEGIANDSTNRYRLTPPSAAYYTGDGSSTVFGLPNDFVSSSIATLSNTEVWQNGLLIDSSNYSIGTYASGRKNITFNSAPADDDTIALILKSGHDYEIDSNGRLILLTGWPGSDSSINHEKIIVTTFSNHDQMGMKTQSFVGSATGKFVLRFAPVSSAYVFVSLNKNYLTANHDFSVSGNVVTIPGAPLTISDEIVVTYLNGPISNGAIGYRIFKDILNRYHYRRISSTHSTQLAQDLAVDDTTITVLDGSVLPEPSTANNIPGVVFIGTERIAYFGKSGNTLSRLFRGTLGTGVQAHSGGDYVVDGSKAQEIPYEDTTTTVEKTGDGSTVNFDLGFTPSSADEITVFVGGTKTTDFTVGTDSAGAVTLTTAPADGVLIKMVRKTGTVWYDQGDGTAANGQGLQAATGKEVLFLQKEPTSLELF